MFDTVKNSLRSNWPQRTPTLNIEWGQIDPKGNRRVKSWRRRKTFFRLVRQSASFRRRRVPKNWRNGSRFPVCMKTVEAAVSWAGEINKWLPGAFKALSLSLVQNLLQNERAGALASADWPEWFPNAGQSMQRRRRPPAPSTRRLARWPPPVSSVSRRAQLFKGR